MTILVKVAEPRRKPVFVGLAAACFATGLVVAPVVGGGWLRHGRRGGGVFGLIYRL